MGSCSERALPAKIIVIVMTIMMFLSFVPAAMAEESTQKSSDCASNSMGECYNRPQALKLKIIAIASILAASMLGICLPLFSTSVPALSPEKNLFFVVKAFASGVILSTGFMHVLPDSFMMLQSPCLEEKPWHDFPFTTFVSMLSAIVTLMLDSFSMAFYAGRSREKVEAMEGSASVEMMPASHPHGHGASLMLEHKDGEDDGTLRRNRVIAQVGFSFYLSKVLNHFPS